jgi:hypothetical protein
VTSDAAEQHPDFVCPDAALQDDPRAPTKGHGPPVQDAFATNYTSEWTYFDNTWIP